MPSFIFSTCCYHTLSLFPWNFFCTDCLSVALLSCNYFLVWECGVRMHEITFWNKKQQNCIIRRRTRWSDTFWYQIAEEVWIRVIVIGRHIYLKNSTLARLGSWIACWSYILINLQCQPKVRKICWRKMFINNNSGVFSRPMGKGSSVGRIFQQQMPNISNKARFSIK